MVAVTVVVPDALDEVARQRGETPEALARLAVDEWLLELGEQVKDERAIHEFEARETRGEARLVDWDDVKAEWDALPDQAR